jgi:hypothetical protein
MDKRPLSLTIIGWWMVISALLTAYSVLTMGSNELAMRMLAQMHVSLLFQQVMGTIGIIVSLACAYGLFKGLPWSRVVYVGWSIVGMGIGFVTSPMKSIIILSAIVLLIIAYFLFRPAADRWFAARGLQLRRGGA